MFNKKKIEKLEREIEFKNDDITKLNVLIHDRDEQIFKLKKMIEELTDFKDEIPEDCIRGSYCQACEFAKEYHHSKGLYARIFYMCTKGNACSNFVQKER